MTYMPNRYSYASAGKVKEPHAGEITALVHELKRRKLALETKNPVLAERLIAITGGLRQLIGGVRPANQGVPVTADTFWITTTTR